MSDVKDAVVSDEDQVQTDNTKQTDVKPQTDTSTQTNEELIDSLLEKKLDSVKSFYEEKMETLKKQNAGLDRRVSELTKINKKYETEKMTEEERFELEKKELRDQYQSLFRERAIANNGLIPNEDETISFSEYLYGDNEQEVNDKAARLKEFIDNRVKSGIEKGVEERLAQGYKPIQSGKDGKNDDLSEMTSQELGQKAKEISSMPDGKDKTAALQKIFDEQLRRQRK
jgi:hypothetical protein